MFHWEKIVIVSLSKKKWQLKTTIGYFVMIIPRNSTMIVFLEIQCW
jgi:hypothetical protein